MLPEYVQKCLRTLESNGIKAYLVGGCVRDMLLGVPPADYDIASNAPPELICGLFARVIETGIKHGTVTAVIDGRPIEITRMRTESGYSDRRRPDIVQPCDKIETDLSRRDFTVNAMAMDGNLCVTDPFGGRADLDAGVIRTVGDPAVRFSEDALRIMRAFRFSAKLGFEIERTTLDTALKLSGTLQLISAERVFAELSKTIVTDCPQSIEPLIAAGGMTPFGIARADRLSDIARIKNGLKPRLAAFLIKCGADAETACRALKTPNSLRRFCVYAQRHITDNRDDCTLKEYIADIGATDADALYEAYCALEKVEYDGGRVFTLAQTPCSAADLAIGGGELAALGAKGSEISHILGALVLEVRADSRRNNAEYLLDKAEKMIKEEDALK